MTYEFLPGPEPGQQAVTLSPGFTDRVMERVERHVRQRKRRRTIAVVLIALCLVGGVFLLGTRRLDQGGTPGRPETQAGPVTPLVKPAPTQQPAPQQNAVKQARSAAPPAGHDHAVANASAGVHYQEVVPTIDGKAYRCARHFPAPREQRWSG